MDTITATLYAFGEDEIRKFVSTDEYADFHIRKAEASVADARELIARSEAQIAMLEQRREALRTMKIKNGCQASPPDIF